MHMGGNRASPDTILVDYFHGHGDEISGPSGQQNIAESTQKLDALTRAEGERERVDMGQAEFRI